MRVGILGGGQLAKYLAIAASKWGLQPCVFQSESDESARAVSEVCIGKIQDREAVSKFLKAVEWTTFESDFLPYHQLKDFSASKFRPSLSCLEMLSDKIEQKIRLTSLQIPTADWTVFDDQDDLDLWLARVSARWNNGAVLKWARGGYDGKGVHLLRDVSSAKDFIKKGLGSGSRIFAEERVNFSREVAMVSARSLTGDFASYPLVISEQKDGICFRVLGPATAWDVASDFDEQVRVWMNKFSNAIGLTGAFAFELFLVNGRLLVNEIAPRVHNSAHYTLSAASISQFDLHWLAILGQPLPRISTPAAFGMINLLGEDAALRPQVQIPNGLFWYDKSTSKKGRKLGHINLSVQVEEEKTKLESDLLLLESEWRKRSF